MPQVLRVFRRARARGDNHRTKSAPCYERGKIQPVKVSIIGDNFDLMASNAYIAGQVVGKRVVVINQDNAQLDHLPVFQALIQWEILGQLLDAGTQLCNVVTQQCLRNDVSGFFECLLIETTGSKGRSTDT